MSKHAKRVKVDNIKFDQSTDVFSDPQLLDEYLSSLGVGTGSSYVPPREQDAPAVDFSALGLKDDEDSEDVGAEIADMLMQKMGGMPRKNYKKSVEIKGTKSISDVETRSTGIANTPKPATASDVQSEIDKAAKKVRSNIALVKTIAGGMRWLSIRDNIGNGTSAPVVSGDTKLLEENLDNYLETLYLYRKLTGMPAAVYDADEFSDRFLSKGIHSVDYKKYLFTTDDMLFGEDKIVVYIMNPSEKNDFKAYLKQQLTTDELADTGLSITGLMRDTCIMITNITMGQWILDTMLDDEESKSALEESILADEGTNRDPDAKDTVMIDFDNFSNMIDNGFYHIADMIKDMSSSEEETPNDEFSFENTEKFDPYSSVTPSDEAEERKGQGASEDGETFPNLNKDSNGTSTIRISGEDNFAARESDNVSESSTTDDRVVRESTQSELTDSEKEEREVSRVQSERGDRTTSELEEVKEKEEVQTGNGRAEITEVDPESFKFDEEVKEKEEDSMVISVTTVGRK